MRFLTGHSQEAFLMVHGGAGPMDPSETGILAATETLRKIARVVSDRDSSAPNLSFATAVLAGLEDDEQFNAGYGSALQADGQPRLSAALMDGDSLSFSGVISVSDVQNPSRLALKLQKSSSRVLTEPGATRLARKLGFPPANLITEERFQRWLEQREKNSPDGFDTVGVVLSRDGLVAGTSTGGRGFEVPGRVSDSATVAGNYASTFAAISLTGIGEQIVDFGVAVRIETRVRDGLSLEEACRRTFNEAVALGHEYGWIAADRKGNWCIAHTTDHMTFLIKTLSGQELASSSSR
ncbi:MAG: isoaspartyl peptidase/L-asparaginase [Bdellovibrionota bacterium]